MQKIGSHNTALHLVARADCLVARAGLPVLEPLALGANRPFAISSRRAQVEQLLKLLPISIREAEAQRICSIESKPNVSSVIGRTFQRPTELSIAIAERLRVHLSQLSFIDPLALWRLNFAREFLVNVRA
jgi:hypothetical protein